MTYIGIDNGVTGSIAFLSDLRKASYFPMPTFIEKDYHTSKEKKVKRLDYLCLFNIIESYVFDLHNCKVLIERPMVNPMRFASTVSALRCLEATLIVLNILELPVSFIDSKKWQKEFLKSEKKPNQKSKERQKELKDESIKMGVSFYPYLKKEITKQGDADGLLIARYAQNKGVEL